MRSKGAFISPMTTAKDIYIKELGDKEWSTEADCHIRNRLERVHGEESGILKSLDYTSFDPDATLRDKIVEMLQNGGIGWLNKCLNIENAKAEFKLPHRVMTQWQREFLDK